MYTNNRSKGIYALICKINHRIYIGSTASSKGFYNRLNKHRSALRQGIHHSAILQKDYDRYGEDAFEFIILEQCETKEQCIELEQFWLDLIGVGSENGSYNICNRAGIAPSPLGRKQSPETIAKRVASIKANPRTPETRLRASKLISEAHSKSYIATSPEGIEYELKNLTEFCKNHNLCASQMVNVTFARYSQHRGWKCRYATETKEEHLAKIQTLKDSRVKEFIVTSPDGKEFVTTQLAEFCHLHGLSTSAMSGVASGIHSSTHKGWKCRRSTETEEEYLARAPRPKGEAKAKRWIITNPSGEELEIRNLSLFCREHGLSPGWMVAVAQGKSKYHKGYLCRYAD